MTSESARISPSAVSADALGRAVSTQARALTLAGATVASRLGGRLVSVLYLLALARFVSVADYGGYAYLVTVVLTASIFADTGVSLIVTREVSARRLSADAARRIAAPAVFVTGLLAAGATLAIGRYAFPASTQGWPLVVTATEVTVLCGLNLYSSLLRATGRIGWEAAVQFASTVAFAAVGIVVALNHPSLTILMILFLGKDALCLGAVVVRLGRKRVAPEPPSNLAMHRRAALRAGLTVAAGTVLAVVYARAAFLILGLFVPASTLGQFSIGMRVQDIAAMGGSILGIALLPLLARMFVEDAVVARELARRWVARVIAASALAGIAVAAVVPWVVPTLFGGSYGGAVNIAVAFALATPLWIGAPLIVNVLLALGREHMVAGASLSAAAVTVAVALAAIPNHSGTGAFAAMVAGYATVGLIGARTLVRTTER